MTESKQPEEEELTDIEKLEQVNQLKYREQAIWFLNSTDLGNDLDDCEKTWIIHQKCVEFDKKNEDGSRFDKFTAHRILESCTKAFTSHEVKDQYVFSGKKKVSLAELLMFTFGVDFRKAVNLDCSDWKEQREAEQKLEDCKKMLEDSVNAKAKAAKDAKAAKEAERNATVQREESRAAAEASRTAEAAFADTKEQSRITLDELNCQELAIKEKKEKLENFANDNTLGIVKRNKAKAELAAMANQDPLPLRSARINQEASLKKLSKATKRAGEAAVAAELSIRKAEEAKKRAMEAEEEAIKTGKLAEASIPVAQKAVKEVHEFLEELIRQRKIGKGTIFYIERELKAAKQFLPKKKFAEAQKAVEDEISPQKHMKSHR